MNVNSIHPSNMKAAANNPETVAAFEELATKWCKEIEQVCSQGLVYYSSK